MKEEGNMNQIIKVFNHKFECCAFLVLPKMSDFRLFENPPRLRLPCPHIRIPCRVDREVRNTIVWLIYEAPYLAAFSASQNRIARQPSETI